MSQLDQAIAEAYASAPQDRIILHTLEINHKSFDVPLRVVRWPVTDNEPTMFLCRLEEDALYDPGRVVEFAGMPFDLVRPAQSAESPGEFQIRVANAASVLNKYMEAASLSGGQITAVYREYLKGTETERPRAVWPDIKIKAPRMEGQTVAVSGSVLEWMQKPFGYLYTPERNPGLVRSR